MKWSIKIDKKKKKLQNNLFDPDLPFNSLMNQKEIANGSMSLKLNRMQRRTEQRRKRAIFQMRQFDVGV